MSRFEVPPEDAGERADVVLARLAEVPRAVARDALRDGAVRLEGGPVRPSHRLAAGEVLEGEVSEASVGPPEGEQIEVAVRYEDDRVLVVSKPAGLVTHPGSGHSSGTLVNALLGLGIPLGGRDPGRPGIVHRLDKDTSGLLLVARDDDGHAALSAAMKERRIGRRYFALVGGVVREDHGTVDAPLARHPHHRRKMAVVSGGRPAVTHYRVLGRADRMTLLDVTLETGRTHQIRVHLSHLRHPVLGDRIYGGRGDLARGLGLERPFLHAWSIGFPHPDDGRLVEVSDPLPQELLEALERAGLNIPPT